MPDQADAPTPPVVSPETQCASSSSVIPFALGEGAKPRRRRYLKKLDEYASLYGKKKRAVQYWIADGEKLGKGPPPLDDPPAMPAWWASVYSHECPRSILDAARAAAVRPGLPDPPPVSGFASLEVREVPEKEKNSEGAEGAPISAMPDYEIALRRFQDQRDEAWQRLANEKYQDAPDAARVDLLQREYREAEAAVRSAQTHDISMREAAARFVDREQAGRVLLPMLQALNHEMRALLRRNWDRIKEAPDDTARDKIFQDEIDASFAALDRAGWTPPGEELKLVA
jgi:hypothetical protein